MRTSFPDAGLNGVRGYRVVRVVSMPAKQLRNRTVIPRCEKCRLSDLVVATGEECSEGDFLPAAAPAISSWQQAGMFGRSHSSHLRRREP